LLTCYVSSTKIGEISDISKCFENFVSQTLGVLTRIYAAELREYFEINANDLRASEHAKDREIIFKLFGLDASLDYQGNLELCKQ